MTPVKFITECKQFCGRYLIANTHDAFAIAAAGGWTCPICEQEARDQHVSDMELEQRR